MPRAPFPSTVTPAIVTSVDTFDDGYFIANFDRPTTLSGATITGIYIDTFMVTGATQISATQITFQQLAAGGGTFNVNAVPGGFMAATPVASPQHVSITHD